MDDKKLVHNYFEPKRVGEDLSEVALELLNVESQQIESRWFHSQYETDLFIWSDLKGKVIKQQITFFGQVVEWNFLEGARTGVIFEDEVGKENIKASEIIQFDKSPSMTTINMAIEIIRNVKNISDDLRACLIFNFNQKIKGVVTKIEIDALEVDSSNSIIAKIKKLFKY